MLKGVIMSGININGVNYKEATRNVNGEKQEVLVKNGEVYLKNADGTPGEKLQKNRGSIYGNGFTTEEYRDTIDKEFAESVNKRDGGEFTGNVLNINDPSNAGKRYKGGVLQWNPDSQELELMMKANKDGAEIVRYYSIDESGRKNVLETRSTNEAGETLVIDNRTGTVTKTKGDIKEVKYKDGTVETFKMDEQSGGYQKIDTESGGNSFGI